MDLKREIEDSKALYQAMQDNPGQEDRIYLEFLTRQNLQVAVKQADHDGITKCIETLRAMNAMPLSYDEVLAMHRCRENLLTTGPKKKEKPFHRAAVIDYRSCCAFPDLARFYMNRDKQAFEQETEGEVLIQPGSVLPVWKYPYMERERRLFPLPRKGEIKRFICKIYGIGERTFDRILAEDSKKSALLFYQRLIIHKHLEHEEARRQTLQATGAKALDFDRWLGKERNTLFF